MYAITSSSYRAIASETDLLDGETAVDAIPDSLLTTLHAADMRRQRDALLGACDWTQGADSLLDAATKATWATYRQTLRDVPAQPNFPDSIDWPTQP